MPFMVSTGKLGFCYMAAQIRRTMAQLRPQGVGGGGGVGGVTLYSAVPNNPSNALKFR